MDKLSMWKMQVVIIIIFMYSLGLGVTGPKWEDDICGNVEGVLEAVGCEEGLRDLVESSVVWLE